MLGSEVSQSRERCGPCPGSDIKHHGWGWAVGYTADQSFGNDLVERVVGCLSMGVVGGGEVVVEFGVAELVDRADGAE